MTWIERVAQAIEKPITETDIDRLLTPGERRVLQLRYSGWNLREAADQIASEGSYPGVEFTRERVRQIEVRALNKLREQIVE